MPLLQIFVVASSPKFTFRLLYSRREVNSDLLSVMYLEHTLSEYHKLVLLELKTSNIILHLRLDFSIYIFLTNPFYL